MASPWSSFDKKVKERELLPPLVLAGEKFQFPSSPPAILFFKVKQFENEHGRPMSDHEAVDLLLPHLIDAEAHQRFLEKITTEELPAFIQDLFTAWGWYTPEEDNPRPNRETRRASQKKSSKGSARSKQTSSRTTASTSA